MARPLSFCFKPTHSLLLYLVPFSVPVMSHFAALNICQTWNIFACETHLPCMRSQTSFLICPLFFCLSSELLTDVLCRLSTLTNFFFPPAAAANERYFGAYSKRGAALDIVLFCLPQRHHGGGTE